MNYSDWFDILVVGSLLITIVFWILFAVFTMRKIDRTIVSEGKPRPCQWDPMWGRAILYAWPAVLPEKLFSSAENRIIDTNDVKRIVNYFDKTLAWGLLISGYTLVVSIIIGWIFSI
ncbi:hypothetical protein [Pseudomaricurvus sp.]|uniref:hypothetical protein n=1 Tax=Pseudomaricurvus sp. TaxID=2004510 RepID=UPI003F6D0F2B